MATNLILLPDDGSYIKAIDASVNVFMVDNISAASIRYRFDAGLPTSSEAGHTLVSSAVLPMRVGEGDLYVANLLNASEVVLPVHVLVTQ